MTTNGGTAMKEKYKQILKTLLQEKVIESRNDLCISQEEMAHRLSMAGRSYIDLEHGKSGCSALTLALYLVYLCPDSEAFLKELRDAFDEIIEKK